MPSHVSMWHFSMKITLSPAEQAHTICFRLQGPVQATHFVCLALGLPHSTIFRHFVSIFYGIPSTFHSYVDFLCTSIPYFGHHHHHRPFGRFLVIWPQCHYLPTNSHQTLSIFHQFFDFRAHTCLIWLSPPTWGCHHPPPSIGQTSHPPAGPSATPCSIPHRFY